MEIEDGQIEWAEQLLLPEGAHFDEERCAFIRCMVTRDVVACPGSGKTTALLAKILILSSRMPFDDGRGICVLTHTNVAIDEIKRRVGSAANSLFRHPNFFGTIQSFVDRFLALPAYAAMFNSRPIWIDEDVYLSKARSAYFSTGLAKNRTAQRFIFGQIKHRISGLDRDAQTEKKIDFISRLVLRIHADSIDYERDDTGNVVLSGRSKAESYQAIHAAKHGLLEEGYLRYRDAFSLAEWHIIQHPILPNAFAKRFAYVFIDEMQDTDTHQLVVLDKLFHSDSIIVQRLGDPNQAIYHAMVKKEAIWSPSEDSLHLSDSMRFGATIARVLDTVRINRKISLAGNPIRPEIPPYILAYDDDTIERVLPRFAGLVEELELHLNPDAVFKAVGWVGKDRTEENKRCIRSYFRDYRKSIQNRNQHFGTLLSYLHRPDAGDTCRKGAAVYRRAILAGMTRALDLADLRHPRTERHFSVSSLLRHLRAEEGSAYSALLGHLSRWVLAWHCGASGAPQIRDEAVRFLQETWPSVAGSDVNEFLNSDNVEYLPEEEHSGNCYTSPKGTEIQIGTVHSVKGETHTATLYLETSYYGQLDSERLLPFLKGEYPKAKAEKDRHIENLKVAHVGFSRPTHLLAVACAKSAIQDHRTALEQNGWCLLEVSAD